MAAKLEPWQLRLVTDYMPMVRALVNTKWRQSSRELQEDLIQQGYLALVDAVIRYNPVAYPTTTFGGYAKWRVHKYINEYQQMDTTIRKPWSMIKSGEAPELKADVPLQYEDDLISQSIIEKYGEEEQGFATLEDRDHAHWLEAVLNEVSADTKALYLAWMRGEINWMSVSSKQQELLFALDARISKGSV